MNNRKRLGSAPARRPHRPPRPRPANDGARAGHSGGLDILERSDGRASTQVYGTPPDDELNSAFRVLIAVHRPRFRGRAERAANLVGWQVTSLLNKQDVVGQVARPPRPPDILVISNDFGRQKDLGIFRAVQGWREKGMRIVALVDDCSASPEAFPSITPEQLCDVCLQPPYVTADLRALFSRLYEQMRGRPAPLPVRNESRAIEIEELDGDAAT